MIRVTVTPRGKVDLYGQFVAKEVSLRQKNQGTLHRKGPKKKGEEKWAHASYPGWVRFQKCLSGVAVAVIRAKDQNGEWQLLSSFIGFLDRHFREHISTISIAYETDE
ncbi:MAG: hypothetical protein KDA75_18040 [Planctomycetaceae bacterium]|nr:hypothetical protein [Planctomycetaceae bacterium]